jgi:hypothetical protein
MNKLKLGIVSDGLLLPAWMCSAVEMILASEQAEVLFLIKLPAKAPNRLPFLYSVYKKRDDRKALNEPDALELKDAQGMLKEVPVVEEAEYAVAVEVDLILNLSSQRFDSSALRPRYGVWNFFFGEGGNSQAPGAWEVMERRSVIASGVEMRAGNGETKTIYRSYSLCNPASVKQSMNSCYWKTACFVPRLLRQLYERRGELLYEESEINRNNKYLKAPPDAAFLRLFISSTSKRIMNKLKRLSVKTDWALMYAGDGGTSKQFSLSDFNKLVAPPGYFWADPVAVEKDGKIFLFVEEYVYTEQKGRIAVMEMDDSGNFSAAVTILERPYHLSYPFVFEADGTYYMIPESSDNKTIELYECVHFPYQWEFKRNLMEGVAAVDNTVFRNEGKWWLFTNMAAQRGASLLDELFLFSTDDIINSELNPHPQNPVVSDVRRARPAGPLFSRDNVLYRPSQICAPYYGWGISVNKIIKLTEHEYAEERVEFFAPDLSKGVAGLHTINYCGGKRFIDALINMRE